MGHLSVPVVLPDLPFHDLSIDDLPCMLLRHGSTLPSASLHVRARCDGHCILDHPERKTGPKCGVDALKRTGRARTTSITEPALRASSCKVLSSLGEFLNSNGLTGLLLGNPQPFGCTIEGEHGKRERARFAEAREAGHETFSNWLCPVQLVRLADLSPSSLSMGSHRTLVSGVHPNTVPPSHRKVKCYRVGYVLDSAPGYRVFTLLPKEYTRHRFFPSMGAKMWFSRNRIVQQLISHWNEGIIAERDCG